ncbi:hypothetical protein F2Q69_00058352 [Brassica cretica]|uniref:Uncharacterized protein n=1 Tax=Brassica cretica TaxID=69181 RepID=A0A8S9RRF0_BRACR|nr:hypothetical protein F2Q69_00058352 [Brassica cretica]
MPTCFERPPRGNTNLQESAAHFFRPKPLSGPCYFLCPGLALGECILAKLAHLATSPFTSMKPNLTSTLTCCGKSTQLPTRSKVDPKPESSHTNRRFHFPNPFYLVLSKDQRMELSHSNLAKTELCPAAIYCIQLLYSSNKSLSRDQHEHRICPLVLNGHQGGLALGECILAKPDHLATSPFTSMKPNLTSTLTWFTTAKDQACYDTNFCGKSTQLPTSSKVDPKPESSHTNRRFHFPNPFYLVLSKDQRIELSHSNLAKNELWPAAIYCVQLLYSSNKSLRSDRSLRSEWKQAKKSPTCFRRKISTETPIETKRKAFR